MLEPPAGKALRAFRALAVAVPLGILGCTGELVRCVNDCHYFGQEPPGCEAEIFAPGILSTDLHEDGAPAFTPDGNEIYFRAGGLDHFSIFFVKKEGRAWSGPWGAPFSREGNHGRIAISPDGSRMFFSSNRQAAQGEETRTDFDIWYVDRVDEGWGTPVRLGPEVNTTLDELDMSVASDLTLYFNREGPGPGVDDILYSRYEGGRYTEAIAFGQPLNSGRIEAAPHISPDQTFLIFTSEARAGSRGDLDLYVSFRSKDGSWLEPRNLGDGVNTRYSEKFASLSPDGRFLFFSSNRPRSFSHLPGEKSFGFDSEVERTAFFNRPKVRPHFTDVYWVSTEVMRDSLGVTCTKLDRGS